MLKLKFAAKQLGNKIKLHISEASNEFSELPTTEYDQSSVNHCDVFPVTLMQQHHFNKVARENVFLPVQKIILRRKLKFTKNKYMKFYMIELFTHPHIHQYYHTFQEHLLD